MLTETILLRRLQRSLGSDIYGAFDTQWFIDILEEESLITFSTYYPFQVTGVAIRKEDGIPSLHPQTGQEAIYKYRIPKETPTDEYIGIEWSYFPGNHNEGGTFSGLNPILTDAMYQNLRSYLPIPPLRFVAKFEPPDLCVVEPPPLVHVEFTLIMNRVRRLHEIPLNFKEIFLKLYTFDVKDAIYNEIKSARDSGTYNGIEINTYISDFSTAASDRDTLLELLEEKYAFEPSRYATMLQFGY